MKRIRNEQYQITELRNTSLSVTQMSRLFVNNVS